MRLQRNVKPRKRVGSESNQAEENEIRGELLGDRESFEIRQFEKLGLTTHDRSQITRQTGVEPQRKYRL